MRIVLDTNVFVSAVFFGGVPGQILEAWRDGRIRWVLSTEILDEYQRVGRDLATDYSGADLAPFLGPLAVTAEFLVAPPLAEPAVSSRSRGPSTASRRTSRLSRFGVLIHT